MNRWMEIAYNEATNGMLSNEGGPFGAVIVKDDEIIASAHNEVIKTNDPTAHAEVNAIREASKKLGSFDLSGCVIYTTCYPCPMCLGAIYWARISKIYYGATEDDAARGGFDDKHFHGMLRGENKQLDIEQIEHEKSASLFDIWLEKDDRKPY
ncbi:nucleoside deaminase [Sulfurimonas sp.]|uniref:nucleoside deaminase n=1 Tax=Sulfurimonas sp. TaxID=2022749 RepID=UPI0035662D86